MGNKIKGIVVELGGDATGLNKAISSVTKESKATQKELSQVNKLLKMDPDNVVLLQQKQEILNQSIDKTEEAVSALRDAKDRADEEMANGTEVNEKAYRELERRIIENEQKLASVRQEAGQVAAKLNQIDGDELREVEQSAEDAGDALDDAGKEAADFGDILSANMIADAAKGIVSSIKSVVEETKEYRKIMGTLETSSQAAGYSAEETGEAYNRLFGVLADEQSAATTLANLQALGLSQSDLLDLIDNTIGGWAKYGDSIPIDGLAEAINETVRAGQVTGTFADIINWGAKEGETYGVKLREATEANEEWNQSVEDCETAEDFFNLALSECSSEAERLDLIMQAMSNQGLADMADAWKSNNADIVQANEAQAEYSAMLGELGEKAAPVMNSIQEGINILLGTLLELTEDIDMEAFAGTVSKVFEVISQLISFVLENSDLIITVLSGIGGGLAALELVSFAQTLMSVFSGVTTLTTAFPALGSAIGVLTNPIFLVVAAVVALVALIATKGDEIQAIIQKVDDYLQNVFATDWSQIFGPVLGEQLNAFCAIVKSVWDSIKQIFDGLIDFIRGVFTGDWERAWNGIVGIFDGLFSGLVAIAKWPINAVIGLLNSAIGGVNMLIGGLNKIPGVNIGTIGTIPLLAKGGTVWSGSAIVGEAGPELLTVEGGKAVVQPLSVNTGKVEGLLSNISNQLGSGNDGTPVIVQVTIDGRVVGETAVTYIRRSERASGK